MLTEPHVTARLALPFLLLGTLALAACGGPSEPNLMRFKPTDQGPDEFLVVPHKPLQTPQTNALPAPTPGRANMADPTPREDAVAALGGNPSAMGRAGLPASDAAIVNYANRGGVDPAIRQRAATEDLEYRQDNGGRVLERWLGLNTYYDAYRRQQLDQRTELDRFREVDRPTPSAPPVELKPE
jgi:hypothetical protein